MYYSPLYLCVAGLQPQQLTARSLTPHQINILRQSQQSIIRTQAAGAGGAAQLRAQRLLTPEQLRAQQLKHTTQKVITQQLLVPVGRGGQVRTDSQHVSCSSSLPLSLSHLFLMCVCAIYCFVSISHSVLPFYIYFICTDSNVEQFHGQF